MGVSVHCDWAVLVVSRGYDGRIAFPTEEPGAAQDGRGLRGWGWEQRRGLAQPAGPPWLDLQGS